MHNLQEYGNTGVHKRNTGIKEIQKYRNTGIQEYRNTGNRGIVSWEKTIKKVLSTKRSWDGI